MLDGTAGVRVSVLVCGRAGLGWAGLGCALRDTVILVCPHDSPALSGWYVIGMAGAATKLPSLWISQRITRRTKNDVWRRIVQWYSVPRYQHIPLKRSPGWSAARTSFSPEEEGESTDAPPPLVTLTCFPLHELERMGVSWKKLACTESG